MYRTLGLDVRLLKRTVLRDILHDVTVALQPALLPPLHVLLQCRETNVEGCAIRSGSPQPRGQALAGVH